MKSDGTYKKLPKPSPGKKYTIKKKIRKIQDKNVIFKKVEKKSRIKGNQGIK
jgi:hypothetical protein